MSISIFKLWIPFHIIRQTNVNILYYGKGNRAIFASDAKQNAMRARQAAASRLLCRKCSSSAREWGMPALHHQPHFLIQLILINYWKAYAINFIEKRWILHKGVQQSKPRWLLIEPQLMISGLNQWLFYYTVKFCA